MTKEDKNSPWKQLIDELNIWHQQGLQASFWWRDDDAVDHTEQLEQLLELQQRFQLPLSLAVIPAGVKSDLATVLAGRTDIHVLQHGYAHDSHATEGQKNLEMGGSIEMSLLQQQLLQGQARLESLFDDQFIKVLVPPWNRIENRVIEMLDTMDFVGVSSMWARKNVFAVKELLQVNTHLDPVAWRDGRGYVGDQQSMDWLVKHLQLRRSRPEVADEPTGILSHHLAQSEKVWQFLDKLFGRLVQHPAVKWVSAFDIWCNNRPD